MQDDKVTIVIDLICNATNNYSKAKTLYKSLPIKKWETSYMSIPT